MSLINKMENAVVNGYKTVEGSVVGTYEKIEDAFIDRFLKHDDESVNDARERLRAAGLKSQQEENHECD